MDELAKLRAENERLRQELAASSASASSSASVPAAADATSAAAFAAALPPPPPAEPGAPRRSEGEMSVWCGTWNMGACDPFLDADDAQREELLASFVPKEYDVYVLGVQEGISDAIFEAIEAHTGAFRLPLNARLYSARDASGAQVRSRRVGRAIKVQAFIEDAEDHLRPEPVVSTTDMLDRVWGRGDGALLQPKFTGIAVFVSLAAAPYCRLLGVYKHSFGASEGSKGGVGVGLGLYNVTMAFINTHMASKRPEMRRQQYCEIVDRLGGKLGGRGFGLNESFHHVVWMGDLNVHCKGVSAADAISLIRQGKHLQMLLHHDELLMEKDNKTAFFEYEEPMMGPRFFPTYKKLAGHGPVDVRDSDWASKVYVTAYKEPFYKGGRVMERVPSWTDRIQYHSLPDKWGELMPESVDKDRKIHDQARGAPPIHNYHAVNDALTSSDHSPVFATFKLQIVADEVDEARNVDADDAGVAALQATMGYAQAEQPPADGEAGIKTRELAVGYPIEDVDFSQLHPSLRPLQVDFSLYNLVVEHSGLSPVPRALTLVFPLPFEDSNEIPDRTKVARESHFLFFGRQQESLSARMRTIVSRANRLDSLHMLVKVSLDNNTKAQCVFCLKDGGFIGAGTHMNTFRLPLTSNGLPLMSGDKAAMVQFTLEMNAYERGGQQVVAAQPAVTVRPHVSQQGARLASAASEAEAEQQMQQQRFQQQQLQQQQLAMQQQVQRQLSAAPIAAPAALPQPRPPPQLQQGAPRPNLAGAGSGLDAGGLSTPARLPLAPQPPGGNVRVGIALPPAGAAAPASLVSPNIAGGSSGAALSLSADAAARTRVAIAATRARAGLAQPSNVRTPAANDEQQQ